MYQEIIAQNQAWIDEVLAKIDNKMQKVAVRSRDKIPYTADENGVHDNVTDESNRFSITWWTNGFFGAMMWLLYEATGNEAYKSAAKSSETMMDEAFLHFDRLHHDVGFMWHILSGASYRLTGDKQSRNRDLIAASVLAGRYNLSGGFIRAWNDNKAGWTIIDCMMNIPQLYFASKETGDDRYKQIAMAHADMAMRDHVRPDGSMVHICVHDTATGEVIETLGGQGYEVGSCWSRGHAWGLYGFILSYIHTGKKEYLDTAKKVAHYYIANASMDDYLPLVDYRAPAEPKMYDATAAAISACGLIEIAKHVPEHEKRLYLTAAIKTLQAIETWCDFNENTDPLLLNGTAAYHDKDTLHMPIIYGDFFFVEAMLKLKGREFLPW